MEIRRTLIVSIPPDVMVLGDPVQYLHREVMSFADKARMRVVKIEDHGEVYQACAGYAREVQIVLERIRGIEYKPVARKYRRREWQRNY